ncbi:response regulator [Pedobacter yulinensis]|uniref:Response regulator n=1 Tax=Pedobacter yulinensis TaxID=2126353 RepID=A0A2T3HM90_9SPHI|nr:response regulator [Pedobacter yulinensis]PST83555.1 response regulator [Pedobacter yulinensis]
MKKILIADDDQDIVDATTLVLESANYQCCGVTQLAALTQAIDEFQPDLIILDFMLGSNDGLQITNQLREKEATMFTPIIILTGSFDIDELRDRPHKANDFIEKPFQLEHLINTVASYLPNDEE